MSRRANAIVARAMAKKPTNRYSSAREMREDLVALRALATEQELAASRQPLPSPPYGGHGARHRRGDCHDRRARPRTARRGPSADRTSDPDGTAASPAVSPPSSPQRVRCWDGTFARLTQNCPTPSGRQGLLWVYPTFQSDQPRCRRIVRTQRADVVRGHFCPFTFRNSQEGIRYTEWSSAAAARGVISRDYNPWPEQGVEQEGYTWSVWIRRSKDEFGRFSAAAVYRDWPFSAESVSNTPLAAKLTCDFVEQRAPTTFEPVRSLCRAAD